MNNVAVIVKLGHVRKHPNADRLQLVTIFGNQVVVGLDDKEGDIGLYFDSNLQLSEEFATSNDLIRRKDADGNNAGGMFDPNRKVRCQKFRKERSDGFYIPITSLSYINKVSIDGDTVKVGKNVFKVGDEFDKIEEHPICQKFVPKFAKSHKNDKKGRKKFRYDSIMFKEHIDTSHLGKEIHTISTNDPIVITAKLHGTSHRYGHVLVEQPLNRLQTLYNASRINLLILVVVLGISSLIWLYSDQSGDKSAILVKTALSITNIFLFYILYIKGKIHPIKIWQFLSGTRRVVLQPEHGPSQYHDPALRELAIKPFQNNLRKGETVFFEIVGYEPNGTPIMPPVSPAKVSKDFVKQYGEKMVYKYGCPEKTFDVYVYRMTLTNEDGQSYDYSWNDVKQRCHELGVKHVPEIYVGSINDYISIHHPYVPEIEESIKKEEIKDIFLQLIDKYVSRSDLIDPSHILEGIVVRNDKTGFSFLAYKHKSFEFKTLEDATKSEGIADQEDIQGEVNV